MGVETLEVRQSLDTALQIRQTLADNRVVALLVDRHVGRDRIEVSFFGRRVVVSADAGAARRISRARRWCLLSRAARTRPIHDDRARADLRRSHPARAIAPFSRRRNRWPTALESRIRLKPHLWYHFYRYWDAQDELPPSE